VSATGKVLPKRPYLLRAMHQWITDCGNTPHVIVDAGREGAEVPACLRQGRQDRASPERGATQRCASATRSGVRRALRRCDPPRQVSDERGARIYARETGEGMVFSEQDLGPEPPSRPKTAEEGGARRPQLKVVK